MADSDHGTILIVDDEPELRFILSAHLRAAGYEVIEATDGRTAIDMARDRRPDVIIMDIGLPVLDGIEATRLLRSEDDTRFIPVIMLTARSGSEDVVRGLEAGAQEYLPKPFDVTELLARVRTVHRLAVARRDLDRLNCHLEAEVDTKTRRLQSLYEFMRDLNKAETRDEILDLLVDCVRLTTGAKRISLFLTDAAGEYLVCVRAIGLDRAVIRPVPVAEAAGVTGQVFRTGKTVAARTFGGVTVSERHYDSDAYLSTPLLATSLETKDGTIGVLNVTDKEDGGSFSEEEVDCVRSIADAAGIALDNETRRRRLQESVKVLVQTLGHLAEYRDQETTQHIERVARLARVLAKELQHDGDYAGMMTDDYVNQLVQAAPMHDIGKVGIPDYILAKPGPLSDAEFALMKTHAEIAERVLSNAVDPACPVPLLEMCIDIAYCHHERYDGTGYPRGLVGQDIPLAARIIALVDAYDAITSERRYKRARTHGEAVEMIRADAGTHFDPVIVDAFLRCHRQFEEIRQRFVDAPVLQDASI